MDAVRSFVWNHVVIIGNDGEKIENMTCRFDGEAELERAHLDRMVVTKARKGVGWLWAVYESPGIEQKIANGEETLLHDAMSACEEVFFMTRDVYQDRWELKYLGKIENSRTYGRF